MHSLAAINWYVSYIFRNNQITCRLHWLVSLFMHVSNILAIAKNWIESIMGHWLHRLLGTYIRKWNVCLSCYLATCTLVTQVTSGTFTSPSYPSEYANYLDLCVAYIVGPPGSNITIDFFIFNVEYESSCGYDYLLVRSHCKSHEISAPC